MLDKDLITQPHLWNMSLLISAKSIEALFTPPVATDEVVYRSVTLDPAATTHLKAVEDAVYENPLLLNTFRNISVLIDTDRFTLLPPEAATPAAAARAISLTSDTDAEPGTAVIRAEGLESPALMMAVDTGLTGFLKRTFFNVAISHPLAPVASHFTGSESVRPALTAALRPGGRMDIVATDRRGLVMANTFSYEEVSDAAYFILASRTALGQAAEIPLFVAAPPRERQLLASTLARAVPGINLPASLPYPAELWRSGATLASAPLPLILTHHQ